MNKFFKIIFFIIVFLSIYYFFISYNNKKIFTSSKFYENELIKISISSNNLNEIENLIFHLSSFSDLIDGIYIDQRENIFFQNALKKSNLFELEQIDSFIEHPTILHLLDVIANKIDNLNYLNNDELYFNMIKINSIFNTLYNYFSDELIDFNIGENLLIDIVLNKKNNPSIKKNNFTLILFPSKKKHPSFQGKNKYYIELFNLLKKANDDILKIQKLTFENIYLYKFFNEFNNNSKMNVEIELDPVILLYSNNIDNLKVDKMKIKKIFPDIKYVSILSFLTDNTLKNEKFKLISKIRRKYEKYSYETLNQSFDFQDMIIDIHSGLKNKKHNILSVDTTSMDFIYNIKYLINDSIDKIDNLIMFENNREKIFKENFLKENYSKAAIKNIKILSNTEIILFEDVNLLSKMIYYDSKDSLFISRIYNLDNRFFEKFNQIFNERTSLDGSY